jgi:hypothetical protein
MAPTHAKDQCIAIRFPRPRGDGPADQQIRPTAIEVPPPTRGWPPWVESAAIYGVGSPAHAGMAPLKVRLTRASAVPLPTRGWPRGRLFRGQRTVGSPAHAGMARAGNGHSKDHRRFPRPRGDGPGHLDQLHRPQRFPRPRGDGPCPSSSGPGPGQVPPPTRGWPPDHRHLSNGQSGSPAHAGMAPGYLGFARQNQWFPRPRGDGPYAMLVRLINDKVPPPTRGWPLRCPRSLVQQSGSPAHGEARSSDVLITAGKRDCPDVFEDAARHGERGRPL